MQVARTQSQPGVIDTMGAGFATVNRWPWIMSIPVVVDLLLWRGPHITPLPLFQRLLAWYQDALGPNADLVAPNGQRLEDLRQTIEAAIASFNMLSLLVLNIASVPTSTSGRPGDTPFVVEINNELSFVLLVLILQVTGLLVGCVYLGLIAQQVRDGAFSPGRLLARLAFYLLRVLALLFLLLGAALAVGVPLFALSFLGVVLGSAASKVMLVIAGSIAYFVSVWALLFLFFAVDAIVVSEIGAWRAILNSVLVVWKNFWPALTLIALVFVVSAGTQVIWTSLSYSLWGVVVGIVGNAYIASGLAAAGMLFYQSRLAKLERDGFSKRFLQRR